MKKFGVVVCMWVLLLSVMVSVNAKSEINYQIQYDSSTIQTYQLKDKVQQTYRSLVDGIHNESYVLMVMHNMEQFEFDSNVKATWMDNKLVLQEGDGQGDCIEGVLSANSICVPQVQPRSFLGELFK